MKYILAIDQGTTGTTAMVFDEKGDAKSKFNQEFPQHFPRSGWVEHDPEEIWQSVRGSVEKALIEAGVSAKDLAAIGITNQRETSIFWYRGTDRPYGNAIVWQCRRSADICERLKIEGHEQLFKSRTGLVIDPYFSGTKIAWMMENDREFARLAHAGEIVFGTVDSWVIAKLTGGKIHVTDCSNASRTLIYNIHELKWDSDILDILGIPSSVLPKVVDSSGIVAYTDPNEFFGASVPICGIVGDQQAALFGQACYRIGMTKNTYGTGSFVLMNTGNRAVQSSSGMLTTIAWGYEGNVTYALEGSIFITGAAIQWLRDGLKIIKSAGEAGAIAQDVADTGGVYFVPAMVGLGAPYWDPYARGAILGISRGTTKEHIVRAAVEAIAYQTRDVLDSMKKDSGIEITSLRVDGGASVMDALLSFQSDLIGVPVERPHVTETTALGAAYLAGLATGIWAGTEELEEIWRVEKSFMPGESRETAEIKYMGWKKAVERVLYAD